MKVKIHQTISNSNLICMNGAPKPISIYLEREAGDESQNTWIQYSEIFHELMTSGEANFYASESVSYLKESDDFSPLHISLYCDDNDYAQLSEYIDHLPELSVIKSDLKIKLEAINELPPDRSKPHSVSCEYSNAKIKADFLSRIERVEEKLDDKWKATFFVKHFPDKTGVYEQFGKPETLSN